jgi:hypothetical protein
MKIAALLLATTLALMGCRSSSLDTIADQTIDYQVKGNQYAVVIVEDGVSQDQAKKYAMQKAAEVAKENGYNYFKVDSEGEVAVAKSEKQFPSEQSQPRNLYYELIQSGNFGRERVTPGDIAPTGMYNGYRIVFSCYKEAPSGRSEDVCDYTKCSK